MVKTQTIEEMIMDGDPKVLPYFTTKSPDAAHLPRILQSPSIRNFYTKSIGRFRTLTWFTTNSWSGDGGVLCLSVNMKSAIMELFFLPSQTQTHPMDVIPADQDMLRSTTIFFDDVKAIAKRPILQEKKSKPHDPFTITTPDRILPVAIESFINDDELHPMVKTRFGNFAVSFQQSMDDDQWYVLLGLDLNNKWNLPVSIEDKSFFDMLGFPYTTCNMLQTIFTPNASKLKISLASYLMNRVGIESEFIINQIMRLHAKVSIDDYSHKLEDNIPVKRFDFDEYDEWAEVKIIDKGKVEVYLGSSVMTLVSADR